MKDALKRMLGISQAPAQAEQPNEGVVEMATDVTNQGADLGADLAQENATLKETVAALTTQLADTATVLADKDAKIAELSGLVEAAHEFKAAQAKAAAEAKVAARTAKLAEVIGNEQASTLQVALASLDDAAFDVAVAAMSNKLKVEEANPAFKEVGVDGSADATKLAAETSGSRVMDYLKTIKHDNQPI